MVNKTFTEITLKKIPNIAKKILGKLNARREHFRAQVDGQYMWVGEE